MLPPSDQLTICFAHVAYRLHERFSALGTGIGSFAVRDLEALEQRIGEADVLVISGLWQNSLLDRATKLRFIQSIGAGTDQFPRDELARARHPPRQRPRRQRPRRRRARDGADPRLEPAAPRGARQPGKARLARHDRRSRRARGRARRQDAADRRPRAISAGALPSSPRPSTCASSGCGAIRQPGRGAADAVHGMDELKTLLPEADFVALDLPADEGDRNT